MAVKIIKVIPDSIASELGISEGDVLISINGNPVRDYLDFMFFSEADFLVLLVKNRVGELIEYEIEKGDEGLGIVVESIKPIPCRCRCIFCFMDQMPPNMRRSLYFKDDDYRFSFLLGNYITLTNLSPEDYRRIGEQRLSPLYVSVHTTDPSLRVKMMRHKEAARIMENLRRLVDMGITVHTQIVVCPGINDGEVLERSIKDLFSLFPGVRSVAVVPVGITKFRKGLYPIRAFDSRSAQDVLKTCMELGDSFLKKAGTRFVFPADELFIKAAVPIPDSEFYEDFFQLEDGVGMIARFQSVVERKIEKGRAVDAAFVTGEAFSPFLERLLHKKGFSRFFVLGVPNLSLGRTVTVSGLLFGRDILKAISSLKCDRVILPSVIFNDDGITLDDFSLDELKALSGKELLVAPSFPKGFCEFVKDL